MISRKENLIICDCAQFILDTIANFSKLKSAYSSITRTFLTCKSDVALQNFLVINY